MGSQGRGGVRGWHGAAGGYVEHVTFAQAIGHEGEREDHPHAQPPRAVAKGLLERPNAKVNPFSHIPEAYLYSP